LLLIKSHQIYKDIILLKHHLTDLFPQYDINTNLFPQHAQISPAADTTDPDTPDINLYRPIDSISNNSSLLHLVVTLIDQFIDSSVLSHNLKTIAHTLSHDKHIQFYTDGSLQRNPISIDSMGIG